MLLGLAVEQQQLGLEPVIVSIGEPGIKEKPVEREARSRGVQVVPFRMRPGPNVFGTTEILRYARNTRTDLFHSHGYKGNILLGMLPRRVRRLPVITTIHGWTSRPGLNKMRLYEYLDSFCLRYLDRVVLVNKGMRSHARLRGCRPDRLMVVENGITLPVQRKSAVELDPALLTFMEGGYTVGAIGRLSPEKGFAVLLEAFARLAAENPELRLLIIGEGVERPLLEERIRSLGLQGRVLLPGYREAAAGYIPFLGTFVLPSLSEGLPMVLLEALYAQVAVVATRVGGVPEVLDQGDAGILVSPGGVEELTEGIRKTVADRAGAERMAKRGITLLESRYTARTMAEKYLKVYQEVGGLNEQNVSLNSDYTHM